MSEFMTALGIQKEEQDGVLYGDTDSLIFHQKWWNALPTEESTPIGEIWTKEQNNYVPYHPPMAQTGEKYVRRGVLPCSCLFIFCHRDDKAICPLCDG